VKKNIDVAARIHKMLRKVAVLIADNVIARFTITTCANGRMAKAKCCIVVGNKLSGKNVPLNKNIGVINRNIG
jgi:predicted O-methyltransferase YrrM